MIEALAQLPESMRIEWHHFGDGTERQKLEELAFDRFRSRSNVSWTFHGFVPNAQLEEAYRQLKPDLFLTASSTEGGAPVSIQEAFSMGIPAIGTPVGGIPDLIKDGKTGFLLPQQVEADHMAAAIKRYEELPDEQKRQMSAAARDLWKEKFDANANAGCFAAYLWDLAQE